MRDDISIRIPEEENDYPTQIEDSPECILEIRKRQTISDTESSPDSDTEFSPRVLESVPSGPFDPILARQMVEIGISFSEAISVGIAANYMCDKFRELNISKIEVSDGSETDETTEIDVGEDQLKLFIENAVTDTDE